MVVRHPLQPFDARTVTPGELGTLGRPFTFDPAALDGARAAAGAAAPTCRCSCRAAARRRRAGDIDLAELIALLTHPAKGFLRQRLDVGVRFEQDDPSDALPVELDALQKWGVGDRLLARPAGRGQRIRLPAGGMAPRGAAARPLGRRDAGRRARRPAAAGGQDRPLRAAPRRTVDVVVDLADGRQLRGTVGGVHDDRAGRGVATANSAAAARLRAWIALVALTAVRSRTAWGAATVGRGGRAIRSARHSPRWQAQAAARRAGAAGRAVRQGLREPLPLPVKTAAEYAETPIPRCRMREPMPHTGPAEMGDRQVSR